MSPLVAVKHLTVEECCAVPREVAASLKYSIHSNICSTFSTTSETAHVFFLIRVIPLLPRNKEAVCAEFSIYPVSLNGQLPLCSIAAGLQSEWVIKVEITSILFLLPLVLVLCRSHLTLYNVVGFARMWKKLMRAISAPSLALIVLVAIRSQINLVQTFPW